MQASPALERFLALLQSGKDSALLRYSLGNEFLKANDAASAAAHLERAVELDPAYSAAWKLLGKAKQASGDLDGARMAWQRGLDAAAAKGDKQAEKEMAVFLKRLARAR